MLAVDELVPELLDELVLLEEPDELEESELDDVEDDPLFFVSDDDEELDVLEDFESRESLR